MTPDRSDAGPVATAAPKRRIRVMLVIDGLGIGGAEMVVRDLARHLDREIFDVCVCCTKGIGGPVGEDLIREGLDVFVLPRKKPGRADYLTPFKLRRAARDRGIDIVHSHGAPALFAVGPCKLMTPGLKVVHTIHYGNHPYESWRMHMLECLFVRMVDRLIAVGHEQRRRILETYRLAESRVETVWNGIHLGPPAPREAFRAELGTGDRLLVGTIAKMIEQKGLDDLLTVARRCRDAGYAMQFVIVGDGPLRPMLEERRRALGLEDTVAMPGWIPDAATRALPAFDVFFQPSRWEAMSVVILEAMAAGKAIAATSVGDNSHVIQNGKTGLLAPRGDVDAMLEALARLQDPLIRQRLAYAAKDRFAASFAVECMVKRYTAIYSEVDKQRPRFGS